MNHSNLGLWDSHPGTIYANPYGIMPPGAQRHSCCWRHQRSSTGPIGSTQQQQANTFVPSMCSQSEKAHRERFEELGTNRTSTPRAQEPALESGVTFAHDFDQRRSFVLFPRGGFWNWAFSWRVARSDNQKGRGTWIERLGFMSSHSFPWPYRELTLLPPNTFKNKLLVKYVNVYTFCKRTLIFFSLLGE